MHPHPQAVPDTPPHMPGVRIDPSPRTQAAEAEAWNFDHSATGPAPDFLFLTLFMGSWVTCLHGLTELELFNIYNHAMHVGGPI